MLRTSVMKELMMSRCFVIFFYKGYLTVLSAFSFDANILFSYAIEMLTQSIEEIFLIDSMTPNNAKYFESLTLNLLENYAMYRKVQLLPGRSFIRCLKKLFPERLLC